MAQVKILLVDDVEMFLRVEKTFFQRSGVKLLVARSGREALDLVRSERPHLVFMDLYMPEMNGDEACRAIKADPVMKFTPVVMVTSSDRPGDLERCRDARCDGIVHKPIDPQAFLSTAERFLGIATRAAPRVEARLQVRYGVDQSQLLDNYLINISTGGLFLETSSPLPEETPLVLEFALPDRPKPIRCRGRVAWVNPSQTPRKPDLPAGMGIQFVDLALADMQAIREFIKQEKLAPDW